MTKKKIRQEPPIQMVTLKENEDTVDAEAAEPEVEKLPPISSLEENILTLLMGAPLYGLQICKAIEEASIGKQILKIGSLYPSLHRLERKGLVTSWMSSDGIEKRRGNRRKYYRMTIKGLSALSQKREMRNRLESWSQQLSPQ